MQSQNRFFDDMARLAGGAAGLFAGLRAEIDALVKQQMQRVLGDMELVPREEFEAVKAMAAKAREEQEELSARIAALEARVAALTPRDGGAR
jgi:BMFP domain-containing protein YqiC